jgi:hypothetical protein
MRLGWAVIHLLVPMLFVLVGSVTSVDGQYDTWPNGPPKDPGFFPIAVWLQNPRNAAAYEAAGINVFVGLWRGPTEEQLDQLKAAGMKVVCSQNQFAIQDGKFEDEFGPYEVHLYRLK